MFENVHDYKQQSYQLNILVWLTTAHWEMLNTIFKCEATAITAINGHPTKTRHNSPQT